MSERTAVMLFSGMASDQIQTVNARRLDSALNGKKIVHEKIDGSNPDVKDIRDKLFAVSGHRGKYPQLFIKDGENYEFVGLWEEVEGLLDCDDLDKSVLDANPQIKTFSKVFSSFSFPFVRY
jgi:hypothetical protein